VRWCVRVRVYLTHGREVVGQQRFRLGNVPAAKAIKPLPMTRSATPHVAVKSTAGAEEPHESL